MLKALRGHDEVLAEELDSIRRDMGRQESGPRSPSKVAIDLPTRVDVDFANALQAKLIEQSTASWEFWHGLLLDYVTREGNALVPQSESVGEYRLGAWVNYQRYRYKRGTLSSRRIALLEALPQWTWDELDLAWKTAYSLVGKFARREGHANVPRGHHVAGVALGRWVGKQRDAHRRGLLSADRVALMEALPQWTWDPHSKAWEEGFRHLITFTKAEGDDMPAASQTIAGYSFGKWVDRQRLAYRRGKLTPNQIRRLEALDGWTWDVRAASWDVGFGLLTAFVAEQGHALVPAKLEVAGFRLGSWVNQQRTLHKKGALPPDRVLRLEGVQHWVWDVRADMWEQSVYALEEFVASEGHARVPRDFTTQNIRLGSWVATQRMAFRRGMLSAERAAFLESLQGWEWNPRRGPRPQEG